VGDERVRERVRLLEAMSGDTDQPASSVDPDSRMVTAVEVAPGNTNETVRTEELLRKDHRGRQSDAPR